MRNPFYYFMQDTPHSETQTVLRDKTGKYNKTLINRHSFNSQFLLTVSPLIHKNGWSKSEHEFNHGESMKTEKVSVDEIVQLCNGAPNAEDIAAAEVTKWLGCKTDGGFGILHDDEIVFSVTDTEEEINEGKCSVLNEREIYVKLFRIHF